MNGSNHTNHLARPVVAHDVAPAIVAEDVHIKRGDTHILRGLNCRIKRGSCTAILGPNGCGKTTFTRALVGYSFLTSGRLEVLGETIGKTNMLELRKRISVVNPTADPGSGHISGAVVDGTLSSHDAVLTGFFSTIGLYDKPTEEQHHRADVLLKQVGLIHRRDLRFNLMSTGEQRRCLIARALAHMPELLILDEPTAGLDIRGREQILATVELVLRAPNPPAVLMITHHVEELSPRTDQVLLMKEGRFIASGSPKQVISPESLTETFGCKVFVKKIWDRYWLEVLPEAWLDLIPPEDHVAKG